MTPKTLLILLLLAPPAMGQGDFTLNGSNSRDRLGESVASLGDLDGDGVSDFAVGVPGADYGGSNSGCVDVHSGSSLALLFRLNGAGPYHRMGTRVAAAGDVNGDGIPDIAGAARRDNHWDYPTGYVLVWSGADGSLLLTLSSAISWDRFGSCLAGLGDVNGDGLSDIAVGAHQDTWQGPGSGTLRVFSGLDGEVLHTLHGEHPWDFFGFSVSATGDLDADGIPDFAVGAPLEDTRGRDCGAVHILSGRTGSSIRVIKGNLPHDTFGYSLARIPDIDGDGFDELAVGAVQALSLSPARTGFAQVHRGRDGEILLSLEQFDSLESFGSTVGAADLDGDGTADILVGVPTAGTWSGGNLAGGGVRGFSGLSGRLLLDKESSTGGEAMGFSLCGLRTDVDGDGQEEFLVGAPSRAGLGAVEGVAPRPCMPLDVPTLVAGAPATISLSGAPPFSPVSFQASRQGFAGTPVTPWVTLDLGPPLLDLGNSQAGTDGTASISGIVPNGLTGIQVHFQAWVTNLYGPEAVSRSLSRTIQ